MGRGGGRKKTEFSIYNYTINTEKQWKKLLEVQVSHFLRETLIVWLYSAHYEFTA